MTEKLWCFIVPGPDDLWAMPSKEVAETRCAEHNEFVRKINLSADTGIPEDQLLARVIEWPWSAEDHADALNDPDCEWPMPSATAGDSNNG